MFVFRCTWALFAVLAASACQSATERPSVAAPEEGAHSASVLIAGIDCVDCVVRVALFDSAQTWLSSSRPYRGRLLIYQGQPKALTFYGLPAGRYAVAAYVDRNDNGKLDRWFGVLPREPLGYSVVTGRRLPPSFEVSAFDVPGAASIPVRFGQPILDEKQP
ncbi:MAG: DUF2141 domain-containing protein [Pseudomonadota bacterium]